MDLDRPAVSVGDIELTFVDLTLGAALTGDWQRFAHRSADGARRVDEGHTDPALAKEHGQRFRYERGLLAADDLRTWLTARGLNTSDWTGHLARWAATSDERYPVTSEDAETQAALGEHWWADACLSGLWRSSAIQVARWWAAYQLAGQVETAGMADTAEVGMNPSFAVVGVDASLHADRLRRLAAWQRAKAQLEEQQCTREALTKWLAASHLGWTLLDHTTVCLPTEHAAREARMCIEVDGLSMDEVAGRAGRTVARTSVRFADLDRTLGSALLGATPDSLVGPIPVGSDWTLALLHERRPATLDDPVVRNAARTAIVDEAVELEVAGRVRELAPL